MGKRGRGKGIATAALRAAAAEARGASRANDVEAQQIAGEVYNAVVEYRPHAGQSPMWAMGPLAYVAEMAGASLVAHRDELDRDRDGHDVAAYLLHGLSDLLLGMVGGFDVEHFRMWQRGEAGGQTTQSERSEHAGETSAAG